MNRPAGIMWLVLLMLLTGLMSGPAGLLAADEPETALTPEALKFFEARIRPVLIRHCYECHSTEAAAANRLKAGFSLDTREGLLKGGESGPAIVPGSPEQSLLLKSLRHDPNASGMPPSGKLPADVIADFERWIALGAPDPRRGTAVAARRGMSIEEGRKFWSFISPRQTPRPAVSRPDWPREELDWFVLAKLDEQRLTPLPDASPRTLFRRLSFDLIGLPPDPRDVTDFERRWQLALQPSAPISPDEVLAEAVDSLLDSPHFGERWGRHWLDVARYADSNGRDRNVYFYHAWRYRDYVIASFQNDKPFDQFIREQIAGDLLPVATQDARDEQRIATGFLALGSKTFEEAKPEVFRMDVVDEQIELVSRAVLGLSVGCARCHDHKFDAIPTADYYALAGLFRSTETLYGYGPKGIKATAHANSELLPVGPDAERLGPDGLRYLARLQELTLAQNTARSDRYRVVRRLADAKLQLVKPQVDNAALEQDIARMEAEIRDWDQTVKAAETALQTAMDSAPPQPGWAMSVRDRATPEDSRIHLRGDVNSLGDSVPRGMLQVIALTSAARSDPQHSGRLQLAEWLTSRDNPLTARVFVNRVWRHLFGRGLVTTPDDYGVNGARPSHPELLDQLAVQFMSEDWSVKRLIRHLILSRAYRMASGPESSSAVDPTIRNALESGLGKDPDNVFVWRMSPRRIEAEIFRDAVMNTAGTLKRAPPTPEENFLMQFNPYREDEYRTFKPLFTPGDIDRPHRSVYLPVIRGVLPEVFQLFDFAAPERSVAQRDESTVPAQALYLMNSPWVIQQARQTALRLLTEEKNDRLRIVRLYQLAFSREPQADELIRVEAFLNEPLPLQKADPLTSEQLREELWTSLCQAVFASAEFRVLR